jgi:hypothetical protein
MKTFLKIWLVPIILGVISAIGLLSALTGDSIWDLFSWITLGIPLLVGAYFLNKHLRGIKRVN